MNPSPTLPPDYAERAYAGVLGKIIGVYMGRPIEGWSFEAITKRFGEASYYLNQHPQHPQKPPLIVTDDDISGTFGFFRALADHGFDPELGARQIGRSWRNYIIEGKTVLWWGGVGLSTEHTAFVRLKQGVEAPESGSIARNGAVVAEQIGAQIFIDAWGLCNPGRPDRAARMARAAGSVSHDGEAVHGAVVVATLIAQAFVERDLDKLLDCALGYIPGDCVIARLIGDLRAWVPEDRDWRKTRERVQERYGYHRYGGNCHIVPNHALILLALLYAPDDFSEAQNIVNTCGWDTDCNAANVGAIQGVRLGLDAINRRHDWRGPVADRLFLPTAEGSRAVSDAVIETDHIVHAAHRLAGLPHAAPKGGARWHFSQPGSTQGWLPLRDGWGNPGATTASVPSPIHPGSRCLRVGVGPIAACQAAGVAVNTWFLPEEIHMAGYGCIGNPVLYAGQTVRAVLRREEAGHGTARVRLVLRHYNAEDQTSLIAGPWQDLVACDTTTLAWQVPDTGGLPIFELRLECSGDAPAAAILLDSVRIDGVPRTSLVPTGEKGGKLWPHQWVNALNPHQRNGFFSVGDSSLPAGPWQWICNDEGGGNISIGAFDWGSYRFTATLYHHLAKRFGIGIGYRGLLRFLRLTLGDDGHAVLERHDMEGERELARVPFPAIRYHRHRFVLEATARGVRASIDGKDLFGEIVLDEAPNGGVAVFIEEGRVLLTEARIEPLA
jgi:ADP-ribosylglycohydrolase